MAYYTAFEVMECSWDELMKRLLGAENLDEVIEAHEDFLNSVIRRAMLNELSRDLLTQLRAIYDRVVEFEAVQLRLYDEATSEADSRRNYEAQIAKKGQKGHYGLTQEDEDADLERRHTFAIETMPKLETQMKIVSQSYQDMVRTFLLQLTVSQDQSLQCLSFRLDFNTHYKRKNARLGILH
jgi:gamma-tubulin complex component 3